MTPAEIATAIIIALGGASLIPKSIEGFRAWRTGKAREEKNENRSLLTRTVNAETRLDRETEFRRRVEEWGGRLAYMLAQLGVPAERIPAKPEQFTKEKTP